MALRATLPTKPSHTTTSALPVSQVAAFNVAEKMVEEVCRQRAKHGQGFAGKRVAFAILFRR